MVKANSTPSSAKSGIVQPQPSRLPVPVELTAEQQAHEATVKNTIDVRNKLVTEWGKGPNRNLVELDRLLETAKVLLTKIHYMPLRSSPSEAVDKELNVARDILEIGAKASVVKMEKANANASDKAKHLAEFDRYISQLKHYYYDLKLSKRILLSDSMYEILGMNLLKLLSQNRISEFHLELELFIHPDAKAVLNNVYIKKAVEVEQYLTEGRYNKVLALHVSSDDEFQRAGISSTGFRYFIEQVVENSREVIAEVIEVAYERLRTTVAAKALHSGNNPQVLKDFARKRNWKISSDGYVYFRTGKSSDEIVPSEKLITEALSYAKELDTIV